MEELVVVARFDTAQCRVTVYDTKLEYHGHKIYCIESVHGSNGKVTTRFGTKPQIHQIIKTYTQVRKGPFIIWKSTATK